MSSRPGLGVTQFVVIIFILEARFPFFCSKAISHSKPISYGTQQNIYNKKPFSTRVSRRNFQRELFFLFMRMTGQYLSYTQYVHDTRTDYNVTL